ncbi:MAG: Gfo/Idh/MocA family oxidoreductase [Fibrobacterota bacterium]
MSIRPKIAVVGLRFGNVIAKELSEAPASDIFELAAVCDMNRTQADIIAARHPGVPVYYTLDDVLARPEIRAVALMTPPVGRAELVRKIIRSGRAVMTTKPFERDTKAAAAVLEEARALKIPVHLNSPSMAPSPMVEQVRRWREEYNLGQPIGLRADLWAHKPAKPDGSWYDDPVRCPVAPIYRIGIYCINDIIQLFGQAQTVNVLSSRLLTERPTPDNGQLSILFKNGALGNLFVSFCIQDGMDHNSMFTFNFEKGTLYSNAALLGTGQKNQPTMRLIMDSGKRLEPVIKEAAILTGSTSYAWQIFRTAMEAHTPNPLEYDRRILQGLAVIEAMAAAEKSGRQEPVEAF